MSLSHHHHGFGAAGSYYAPQPYPQYSATAADIYGHHAPASNDLPSGYPDTYSSTPYGMLSAIHGSYYAPYGLPPPPPMEQYSRFEENVSRASVVNNVGAGQKELGIKTTQQQQQQQQQTQVEVYPSVLPDLTRDCAVVQPSLQISRDDRSSQVYCIPPWITLLP